MSKDQHHCCKPTCENPAEYEIWHGSKPDDYTHSCLEHIPDLLTDAQTHRIDFIGRQRMEPTAVYLRDVGTAEDKCWVPCAKGDPGATEFLARC